MLPTMWSHLHMILLVIEEADLSKVHKLIITEGHKNIMSLNPSATSKYSYTCIYYPFIERGERVYNTLGLTVPFQI